jgi:hypothetical protein
VDATQGDCLFIFKNLLSCDMHSSWFMGRYGAEYPMPRTGLLLFVQVYGFFHDPCLVCRKWKRNRGLEPGPDLYALFCGFKEGCVGHLDLPGCVPFMYNPSNQPRYWSLEPDSSVSYNLASVSCIHPKELIINLNSSLFLILNTAVFSFTAIL